MSFPKVKFEINPAQDYQNYRQFIKYSAARFVSMFLPRKLKSTLKNCRDERSRNRAVKNFVEHEFEIRRSTIKSTVAATQKTWRAHEREYFQLLSEVFKQHPWPKGKYIGYASIFNMYPRRIHEKTFHFSALQSKHSLATVAHEMTHFIFYDYLKRKYGLNEDSLVPKRGANYIWNVSEVFNLTLETWPPYQKIFKTSGRPYDAVHARMLPRMKRIWQEKPDIDYMLRQYFGEPK